VRSAGLPAASYRADHYRTPYYWNEPPTTGKV
jgi:hypothetical protein